MFHCLGLPPVHMTKKEQLIVRALGVFLLCAVVRVGTLRHALLPHKLRDNDDDIVTDCYLTTTHFPGFFKLKLLLEKTQLDMLFKFLLSTELQKQSFYKFTFHENNRRKGGKVF